MNATVNTRLPGVGLALSGGGYRATLFHLGTLLRLAQLGILEKVVHVASVSGGSIASGVLAADLATSPGGTWLDRVARITTVLREFCSHTIDTGTIVGGALNPFRRISDLLANKYDAGLFHGLRMDQLAVAPGFTFCATNLQTGRLVHIVRRGLVDYRIGFAPIVVPLARAVAASSAFPPFLSPVEVDCSNQTWTPTAFSTLTTDSSYNRRLYLADGGAYDNMGLEPVWNRFEDVLVSDAGAPYQNADDISTDWFSQLHAAFEIATDQARGVRKRWLVDQFQRGVSKGTYWGINTDIANYQLPTALAVSPAMIARLSGLRTRLNAFTAEEQELLINWGYAVCDAAMRRWCATLCGPAIAAAPALPYPARVL